MDAMIVTAPRHRLAWLATAVSGSAAPARAGG